jgi:hypothetical protein
MDDFEQFWKEYPRRVAKAEARKAWKQTERVRPNLAMVLKAVKAASQTEQWMRGNGQFIPHASTWLRGERWEDEFEVVFLVSSTRSPGMNPRLGSRLEVLNWVFSLISSSPGPSSNRL